MIIVYAVKIEHQSYKLEQVCPKLLKDNTTGSP